MTIYQIVQDALAACRTPFSAPTTPPEDMPCTFCRRVTPHVPARALQMKCTVCRTDRAASK